jgi:Fe-S oxidoreductase
VSEPAAATVGAPESDRQAVLDAVRSIGSGPRSLRLYMDLCARCGACAEVCPVYAGKPDPKYNPARRSDLLRALYKRHHTLAGRLLGALAGARDFDPADLETWQEIFYSCTTCRRCAQHCPVGIDNAVITRKARQILDRLGRTPARLRKVVETSLATRNTDGASAEAFKAAIDFIVEEMRDEHGTDIEIPVDVVGAEYLYLPPSGDALVNIEATMGVAKVFHVLGLGRRWTMSSRCFDGANYGLFTGNDAAMKQANQACVDEAKRLGVKVLLMGECGHAHRVMKRMMETGKWWGDLPFSITNCMEWTARHIEAGRLQFDRSQNPQPVTCHDPCNFAKSCGIVEAPRVILRAACADFREMTPHGADNWCCGGGGGLSAMNELREFRVNISGRKKHEQIVATGATYVAAACANCKRQLGQLLEHHGSKVVVGGVHDLLSRAILIDGKAALRKCYD